MEEETARWDAEYRQQGIPSSHRSQPSGVVRWALHNWAYAADTPHPQCGLDVGCGTGRNTRWLATQGIPTLGIDWSGEAIARATAGPPTPGATFRRHDISFGLPLEDHSVDFVVDTFVYFHQTDPQVRRGYVAQLRRVLQPRGLLLMSLATDVDGYYRQCPPVPGFDNPPVVLDPHAGVRNVLFSEAAFVRELGVHFEPVMHWRKWTRGTMHGREYDRFTLAVLCR